MGSLKEFHQYPRDVDNEKNPRFVQESVVYIARFWSGVIQYFGIWQTARPSHLHIICFGLTVTQNIASRCVVCSGVLVCISQVFFFFLSRALVFVCVCVRFSLIAISFILIVQEPVLYRQFKPCFCFVFNLRYYTYRAATEVIHEQRHHQQQHTCVECALNSHNFDVCQLSSCRCCFIYYVECVAYSF